MRAGAGHICTAALVFAAVLAAPAAAMSEGTCDGANTGIFSFPLGKAKITALSDGYTLIPFKVSFIDSIDILARVLQCTDPRTTLDPVQFDANALYMQYRGMKILLDAGGGPLVKTQGLMPEQLRTIGVDVSEIDHVLITHACAPLARSPLLVLSFASGSPSRLGRALAIRHSRQRWRHAACTKSACAMVSDTSTSQHPVAAVMAQPCAHQACM
jgi:hypothetical protein